jgi:hypothetical protein|tara:strand:+ start:2462 stop:2776 length:315 start_codon:yes stop_codon:yes gene_type:complete
MIVYILLGILAPIFLNLMHLVLGIFVVTQRGSVMSLGFTGVGFLTKSVGMLFLTWLGVGYLGLDMRIFIPLLAFFWFFTHVLEAFVIQHYIRENESDTIRSVQR